jgi:hypothetical protein
LFSLEFNKLLKKIHEEGLNEKNFDYEIVEKSSRKYTEQYSMLDLRKFIFFSN